MPTKLKIRNWSDYNKSLVKRGAIFFTFDEIYLQQLYHQGIRKPGGIVEYSNEMYEFLLSIKLMLRLPWRAATGFASGLLQKAFPSTKHTIPNYAHASRMAGKLKLKVKRYLPINLSEGMEIAFDSTGVSVYTTSGYHIRKHGKNGLYRKKEQWKKIHIAIDLDSMQILSVVLTDSNTNDCEVIPKLCDNIKGSVKNVRADGAYDTEEFHKIIDDWGATALIPPARTSKSQDELKNKPKVPKKHLAQRDRIIGEIRKYEDFDEGLKAWKVASGYHRRSLIEATMFRIKRAFGFYLQAKTTQGRINEIITKVNLLNQMASFGRAQYCC